MEKVCRECGVLKPLADYYRHAMMADGHLNKCKPCVKTRVADHRVRNVDRVRDYDRRRYAEMPHRQELARRSRERARLDGRAAEHTKRWQARYPEKRAAHIKVGNAIRDGRLIRQPCQVCGSTVVHAHHDDYSRPLDVRWLCIKHHAETWSGPRKAAEATP